MDVGELWCGSVCWGISTSADGWARIATDCSASALLSREKSSK